MEGCKKHGRVCEWEVAFRKQVAEDGHLIEELDQELEAAKRRILELEQIADKEISDEKNTTGL